MILKDGFKKNQRPQKGCCFKLVLNRFPKVLKQHSDEEHKPKTLIKLCFLFSLYKNGIVILFGGWTHIIGK